MSPSARSRTSRSNTKRSSRSTKKRTEKQSRTRRPTRSKTRRTSSKLTRRSKRTKRGRSNSAGRSRVCFNNTRASVDNLIKYLNNVDFLRNASVSEPLPDVEDKHHETDETNLRRSFNRKDRPVHLQDLSPSS